MTHSDPALAVARDVRAASEPAGAGSLATAALNNTLLRALPPDELVHIFPLLEPVAIAPLQRLAEPGAALAHAWFPERALLSVVRRMRDGASIEVATVGREGMVGHALVLGDAWFPSALVGQVPGSCLCIALDPLRAALPHLPTLAALVRRSALAFADQVAQRVACNSLHTVEQRCAHWLLAAHDGVGGGDFHITHEALAQTLGVRRAGVTEAALALQRAGRIRYSRGHVAVLDRSGLERAACECYGVVRANRARLLGQDGEAGGRGG